MALRPTDLTPNPDNPRREGAKTAPVFLDLTVGVNVLDIAPPRSTDRFLLPTRQEESAPALRSSYAQQVREFFTLQPRPSPIEETVELALGSAEREVVDYLRRIDLARYPLPMRLVVRVIPGLPIGHAWDLAVEVVTMVLDRNADRFIEVKFSETMPISRFTMAGLRVDRERATLDWVHHVLKRVVAHELEECLLVREKEDIGTATRPLDPHHNGRNDF